MATLPAGTHNVALAFLYDFYEFNMDRNLYFMGLPVVAALARNLWPMMVPPREI